MHRLTLCHWNREEAVERLARLRKAGFEASAVWSGDSPEFKAVTKAPPDAFVIDLGRLPSHGKYTALALRSFRATRQVPLVFIEGDRDKTAALRRLLPDAVYTTWARIGPAVKRAIAHPPQNPVNPESRSGGPAGTPLPKKLGVKDGSVVALAGAPEGFERTLGALPEGARTIRGTRAAADLTIWFVRSRADLDRGLPRRKRSAGKGGLWICWPKKASGVASDLDERVVREAALAAGLVDFKVCSVDATWSGLRFTIRAR